MKKLILLLMVFLLTGCYDYMELDNMGIVSTMFIDQIDDEYVVHLEILNTNKSIPKGSYFVEGSGKTFTEAVNSTFNSSDFVPYYSHMNAVILSEDIAKNNIEFMYEFFTRNIEVRKNFYVYVAQDIDEFLDFETEPGQSIGANLKQMTDNSIERNGRYITYEFRELLYRYLRDMDFTLGSVIVNEGDLNLLEDYAFKDNKMGNSIEEEVVILLNMLNGKNKSYDIVGKNNYEIHEYKFSINVEKDKIKVSLKGNARMLSMGTDNAMTMSELTVLEKEIENKLSKMIEDVVVYTQDIGIDILGINYLYYQKYPKDVKNDTWQNLKCEADVDIEISEKGMILDSLGGTKNGK